MILRKFLNSLISTIYPVITIYSYYVFVGRYCIDTEKFDTIVVLIMFLVYHILLLYTLIFYMRILAIDDTSTASRFTGKGIDTQSVIKKYFNPFIQQEIEEKRKSMLKKCEICLTYKPPRTHHCSICQKCFLKFDNHSLLLGVCIAFYNFKFFYLFLLSNIIFVSFQIILISITLIVNSQVSTTSKTHFIVLITLLAIELIVCLKNFVNYTLLITRNETSIEKRALDAFYKGDQGVTFIFQEGLLNQREEVLNRTQMNPYHLGIYENWVQVFGDEKLFWCLPIITTPGDGINFPKRDEND